MRAYQALLRLATIETETRSRLLSEALQAEATAGLALRRHDEFVLKEREAAMQSHEALIAFASFYQRAGRDRASLLTALRQSGEAVAQARETLAAAAAEQFKIERLIKWREEREALAEARRERDALDEASTLRHARAGRLKP
jgi:flagellar export protein FliJ